MNKVKMDWSVKKQLECGIVIIVIQFCLMLYLSLINYDCFLCPIDDEMRWNWDDEIYWDDTYGIGLGNYGGVCCS